MVAGWQKSILVWSNSASLAIAASATSGSFYCAGYGRLVGIHIANASAKSGSGLRIGQSGNGGTNYDYNTDYAPTACSGSGFNIIIVGNVAKIDFITDSAASLLRSYWYLYPV